MKKSIVLLLILVLMGSIIASGCIGGRGGEGETSPSETYQESNNKGSQETPSPVATWQTPWDAYNPVKMNDQSYHITYIKYTFTVRTSEGERSYEVVKRRGYVKAHIYSDSGGKKDLGEYNFFAYYGKITPLNDPDMKGPLEYLILVKERTQDSDANFLTPFPDFSAMMSGKTAVIEASYGGNYFYWSNPAAIGKYSELPYTEGDFNTVFEGISPFTIQGWIAMISSAVWSGLEDHDLTKPDEYNISLMGISYSYKVQPDGSVSFDGKSFRVSDVEWSWVFGNVKGQGKARIAPALPIPIKTEGTFNQMGGESYYSKMELKDLGLSKEFKGINVEIRQAVSPGETESETHTETPAQTEIGSNNWQLGWDASEPIVINGQSYMVKEVTYEAEYHLLGGSQAQMTIKKGYKEGRLNGREVYILYAIVDINGETYNYTLYVPPEYLAEYTSGALWIPSVGDFVSLGLQLKVEITGPNCHYSMDEDGNFEGDMNCGYIDDSYQFYNTIWTQGGFYGGIYGDVIHVYTLTNSGKDYTVEPDGDVILAGMKFKTYKITWSGIVQNSDVGANGETVVVPELSFPVEVTASLAIPGNGVYTHVKLVDLKLEPS